MPSIQTHPTIRETRPSSNPLLALLMRCEALTANARYRSTGICHTPAATLACLAVWTTLRNSTATPAAAVTFDGIDQIPHPLGNAVMAELVEPSQVERPATRTRHGTGETEGGTCGCTCPYKGATNDSFCKTTCLRGHSGPPIIQESPGGSRPVMVPCLVERCIRSEAWHIHDAALPMSSAFIGYSMARLPCQNGSTLVLVVG